MPCVSTTRLRLRARRFAPVFAVQTWRSLRQVRAAEGFLTGSLLADHRLAFWTLTVWESEADMRRYRAGGAHRRAMPKLARWCDEASVAHWTSDDAPDWADADRRMRTDGRPSKLHHPSPDHAALTFAPPSASRAYPVRPVTHAGP